jgi:hypothetical protein
MSGAATFTQDGSIPTRRCSTTPSDTAKNSNDEIRTIREAVIIQQIETVSVFISRGFFDSLNDRFALCPTGAHGHAAGSRGRRGLPGRWQAGFPALTSLSMVRLPRPSSKSAGRQGGTTARFRRRHGEPCERVPKQLGGIRSPADRLTAGYRARRSETARLRQGDLSFRRSDVRSLRSYHQMGLRQAHEF